MECSRRVKWARRGKRVTGRKGVAASVASHTVSNLARERDCDRRRSEVFQNTFNEPCAAFRGKICFPSPAEIQREER